MSQMTILHVEDEDNDAALLQYAFQDAALTHPVQVVRNGQQAIDYPICLRKRLTEIRA